MQNNQSQILRHVRGITWAAQNHISYFQWVFVSVGQQAMVQDKMCVYVSKSIHIWAAGTFPRDEEPLEELCVFPPQGPSYQIKLGFCKTGETS